MKKVPSHIRLCLWCKKVVKVGRGKAEKELPVGKSGYTVADFGRSGSHTICSVCAKPMKAEAAAMKKRTAAQARTNPPTWAMDKKKWSQAVQAVVEGYGQNKPRDFYAVVAHVYKQMGGGIRRKARGNPSEAEWGEALNLFAEFHEFLPDTVTVATVGRKSMPSLVVKIGELTELTYRSDKWDKGSIPADYTHKFKKPLPMLVSDADGNLYIVGGSYKITADGIVG